MSASPWRGSRRQPGVENMLGHAPPPLTANGLDMRDGHPAEQDTVKGSQARFSRLGALDEAQGEHRSRAVKRKGAVSNRRATWAIRTSGAARAGRTTGGPLKRVMERVRQSPAEQTMPTLRAPPFSLCSQATRGQCRCALGGELEAIAALALRGVQCRVGPAQRVLQIR